MTKIIVTGPESSGKTTICKGLSNYYNIPFSEEYSRRYLNPLQGNYTQEDLLEIAKGQLKSNQENQICDTDLITIKIWSEYKYSSCDNWILDQIVKQKTENRFYLLCKPDIPWEADSLRENPTNREELFKIYKRELEKLHHNYFIVEGTEDERIEKCVSIIKKLSIPE